MTYDKYIRSDGETNAALLTRLGSKGYAVVRCAEAEAALLRIRVDNAEVWRIIEDGAMWLFEARRLIAEADGWNALVNEGCRKKLAPGQYWAFCGETDMGQSLPYLCTECGGDLKLAEPPK